MERRCGATWKRVYNRDLWRTPGERADGTVGPVRSYTFTTSGQPSIGTCTVAPTSGNSQTTLFDLVCLNFMDDDQPLSFTVHYTDLFEEGRVCACVRCLRLVSRARGSFVPPLAPRSQSQIKTKMSALTRVTTNIHTAKLGDMKIYLTILQTNTEPHCALLFSCDAVRRLDGLVH